MHAIPDFQVANNVSSLAGSHPTKKMKLLLVLCLGLVAVATGQLSRDFLVLDNSTTDNDLDFGEMQTLQENGTATVYLRKLLATSSNVRSLRGATVEIAAPGYRSATDAMFDSNNANNNQLQAISASRTARSLVGTATRLYHCSHTTYLLRWFPLLSGSSLTHICFVPWASKQAITYARCTQPRCSLTRGYGRCRPSCFTRRRMLVICYDFRRQVWSWRWVVRYLPQACRCSTC